MTDKTIAFTVCILVVVGFITLVVWIEQGDKIVRFMKDPLGRQRKCIHVWRKMDVNYHKIWADHYKITYYYRCSQCGKEKVLDEKESKLFEKEFMTEWYEHEEE